MYIYLTYKMFLSLYYYGNLSIGEPVKKNIQYNFLQ